MSNPSDNLQDLTADPSDLEQPFVIGIDLGTTNSAISYLDRREVVSGSNASIRKFNVPQLTGLGEFNRMPVLPSFLYLPGAYDIDLGAIGHPWPTAQDRFVGTLARDQGAKVPGRLVSSAKSWLCHDKVDRNARILPWGAPEEVNKVSPVQASAAYLAHIRQAWNHACKDEEELFLENQVVVLTVPASFDEVARELTLAASKMAGYKQVTLIEEPLAAFYSWLAENENQWKEKVQTDELVLVCDVGGGTTDFTLIALRQAEEGSPRFHRIAVGDHLILGGDNMDMALARAVESLSADNRGSLSTDRWKSLCHQCRHAKEQILSGQADTQGITLMGSGSSLIAGTLSAELDRETVERTILDGFFPIIDSEKLDNKPQRPAISEFGLPYEIEPAVSRHLCRFLDRHRQDVADAVGKRCPVPDLVLFNGGSLKPAIVQERIVRGIRGYFAEESDTVPRVIDNPDMDLAVSLGAAYYGMVKTGQGVRVGSGSPRSFYLGVGRETGDGADAPQAICLVERGLDEGSSIQLNDRRFDALANQPVRFDLYSSSYRNKDRSGEIYAIDDSFTRLPVLQTVIQYGKKGTKANLPVSIEAEYTEMGTLALFCRSLISDHRWQLQFQLRDAAAAQASVQEKTVLEAGQMDEAKATLKKAFSEGDAAALNGLVKQISNRVNLSRNDWPLGFIRELADQLLEHPAVRTQSALHEARWLNLLGFCLRPGFGDAADPWRMKKAWKIHNQGLVHGKTVQVQSEWWILWRRIAGGLSPGQQRQLSQEVTPLLTPKKRGAKVRLQIQQQLELWMLVANLERLYIKDKIAWGRLLLSQIKPKQGRQQHFWTLARIGARELLYGPVDRVIPPAEARKWIDHILDRDWRQAKPVVNALVQIARKTGDRTRDLDSSTLDHLLEWLSNKTGLSDQSRFLTEVVPIARQEEQDLFGESLPDGIILHEADR